MGRPWQGLPWARALSLSCQGTHLFLLNLLRLLIQWARPLPDAHLLPSSPCRGEAPVSPLLLHLVGPRAKKGLSFHFYKWRCVGALIGSWSRVKL